CGAQQVGAVAGVDGGEAVVGVRRVVEGTGQVVVVEQGHRWLTPVGAGGADGAGRWRRGRKGTSRAVRSMGPTGVRSPMPHSSRREVAPSRKRSRRSGGVRRNRPVKKAGPSTRPLSRARRRVPAMASTRTPGV